MGLDDQLAKFVTETPVFRNVCRDAFNGASTNGHIRINEANYLVDYVFNQLKEPLRKYGLEVNRPPMSYVTAMFQV